MDKIINLTEYELCLTYSTFGDTKGHGVSGHIYEILDYFYILKNHFKCCILVYCDFDEKLFKSIIMNKYKFTEEEVRFIIKHTIFLKMISAKIIKCDNILIVDGYYKSKSTDTVFYYAKNIFSFCCPLEDAVCRGNNHIPLGDTRIYNNEMVNYKKRILFDKMKDVNEPTDDILLYTTANCRDITNDMLCGIVSKYGKNKIYNIVNEVVTQPIKGVDYLMPPIDNIFDLFGTYIYTPVKPKFDCSPRFIAECEYYNRKVVYHGIDYKDQGLYWRRWDIENDFDSLYLRENDEIIDIIRDRQ